VRGGSARTVRCVAIDHAAGLAWAVHCPGRHLLRRHDVKYGLAWLIGIPIPLIAIWFLANQAGCGF
jgi:hypothetical protein